MLAEKTKTPPRRRIPLKDYGNDHSRHPGAYAIWKRIADNKSAWEGMIKFGANESFGTGLGRLYMEGHLSELQAEAGRYFAKFCAAADHYAGAPKRNAASPAYERGWANSHNDEEALALLQGRLHDWEKRCQRIRRKWDRIHGYFGDEKVFSLLLDVCISDRHCPAAQVPVLRAALQLLALKLHLNKVRREDQPRMQPRRRHRRPKERK